MKNTNGMGVTSTNSRLQIIQKIQTNKKQGMYLHIYTYPEYNLSILIKPT